MHHTFRNVNEGLPVMVDIMKGVGVKEESRNGGVLRIPEPVMITYTDPLERVLFMKERRCNPFLHLADAVHLLAGRNDVAYMSQFSKQITNYSDDGRTFHGAYGKRLAPQLETAIGRLQRYDNDRRTILQIYDYKTDQFSGNTCNDIPCNTQIYLSNTNKTLDMTITQRSGDLMWGTMGANVVQFSYLYEYILDRTGLDVGTITHMCNNLHVYTDFGPWKKMTNNMFRNDVYPYARLPLNATSDLPYQLNKFIDTGVAPVNHPFFDGLLVPMKEVHRVAKGGLKGAAVQHLRRHVKDEAWLEYTDWWLSS